MVFALFQFQPIVGDFLREVAEEGAVQSQQVQRPVLVALVLQQHEVVFPESLVVAVGDECALVQRRQEIVVARGFDESEVAPPDFDVAVVWPILVKG